MEANLLKFKRKHSFLFDLFYQEEVRKRKIQKLSKKAIVLLEQKANECWGYDFERDVYDACIIAAHTIREISNNICNEYN